MFFSGDVMYKQYRIIFLIVHVKIELEMLVPVEARSLMLQ